MPDNVAKLDRNLADLAMAMAKDLGQLLTGARPDEAAAAKAANFLYRCATTGPLATYVGAKAPIDPSLDEAVRMRKIKSPPYYNGYNERGRSLAGIAETAIEALQPSTTHIESYVKALQHFDPESIRQDLGWRSPPRVFATCLDCHGARYVPNPNVRYEYDRDTGSNDPIDPEDIDCPDCGGTGWVEVIEAPTPSLDDDMPF